MKNYSVGVQRWVPAVSVLSLAVAASPLSASAAEFDPVVISASRVEQPLSQVLPSVSVITREDIDRAQVTTLADLLQGEAGFEFGRNGGAGMTTSFFLRGEDSVNMVLMVDGVRAQTDGIGALQITDMPLGMVERVEVLRGNASALYGEAAIGGVIQITTRRFKGKPQAYGSVTAGSYGTVDTQAGYGGTAGEYSFDINAGTSRSDGFSSMNTAQKTTANPDRDGYSRRYFSTRLERRLDADLSMGLRISSRRSNVDTDDTGGVTNTHLFKQANDSLGVFARKAFSNAWTSTIDVSAAELTYDDLKNGVPYQAGDGSWKNGRFTGKQSVVRWSNEYQFDDKRLLSFGLEQTDGKFKAEGDYAYESHRTTKAGFVGMTQKIDRWTLQLNARHDVVDVEHVTSNVDNTTRATTGLLGVGYQLNPNWRLTGTVSSGFRAPTASDVASNSQLKPETHQGQEVGVVYSDSQTSARLVAFSTSSHDAIGFDSNFNTANIGDTRNEGVEASLRTRWLGNTIKLSAVSQNPWSVTYNERLARRAREYASVDVSRPVASYDVGAKVVVSGDRKDSHYSPGVMLGGYALWSVYASRKVDDNWTARVRLENAFDKQYQLAYGYNTPGRGLYVTLQYSPK
jgi:vitamin B12 transporter